MIAGYIVFVLWFVRTSKINTHRHRFLAKVEANNSFEALIFASKFGLLK